MLSRLRHLYSARALITRVVVTVALALALLSGIMPYNTLSSAHLCTMACCAGLAPHAAGSCHLNLSRQRNVHGDNACGAMDMSSEHGGAMQMHESAQTDVASHDHCNVQERRSTAQPPASQDTSSQTASVASLALTQPCSSDCGACSGNLAPLRRSPDAATLPYGVRPRPPTLAGQIQHSDELPYIPTARRRNSRPRAPPLPSLLSINIA